MNKKNRVPFVETIEILDKLKLSFNRFEVVDTVDSYGRVLFEDIVASENSPVSQTSSMDGYAIRFEDQSLGKLEIDGINPAGNKELKELQNQKCIKTFTGSIMPTHSDTLIPIEYVTVENGFIHINKTVPKGFAVRQVGEQYRSGDILIKKGSIISFAEIGVIAGLNKPSIKVVKKPTVTILSTGSELINVGDVKFYEGQIVDSNSYTIATLAKKYGADTILLGALDDNKDKIFETIENALEYSDILVTTGGVSVGDFDFVKDIIHRLNAKVLIPSANIKPGQHVKIAQVENRFLALLPGFAYSSTVTFYLYVKPLIQKFLNQNSSHNTIEAIFEGNYTKKSDKTEFVAVNICYKDGKYFANMDNKKSGSSAILTNLLGNSGLMYIDESKNEVKYGEVVTIYLF